MLVSLQTLASSSLARARCVTGSHRCNIAAQGAPLRPSDDGRPRCTSPAARILKRSAQGASMADTPEPLSEYEQARNEKIARNRAFLAALGLGDAQSPQQARPVVRRPDTPEVVERPKASQDVVDALAKRYPSRRREASLLVSALRSPGDAPMIVTGQESGPVTCEAASQCGLAVARVKCSSDETGSKLLERCAVAADGKSDRVSAESLARRLDAAALAAPVSYTHLTLPTILLV